MSKKCLSFLILTIVLLSSLNLIEINAYPDIEYYKYYEKDYNDYNEGQPFQNHIVFSNVTKKFYSFYSINDLNNSFRYDILNYDGSIFKSDIIPIIGWFMSGPYGDYDIRIDLNGVKVYIFMLVDSTGSQLNKNKDLIRVYYGVINSETCEIDILSTTSISTLSTISTNNAVRHIMGVITQNGYPSFVVDFRITTGPVQYMAHAVFSNGLTNFVEDYNMNLETIWNTKTGENPWAVDIGSIALINPYGTNGLMIFFSPIDIPNSQHESLSSFQCPLYSTLLGGYNAADWSWDYLESGDKYDHLNLVNCDVGYNYDNDICFVWELWLNTNIRYMYAYIWNVGTDSWNKKTIVNAESNTVEYPVFVSNNDRGNFNIISANTNVDDFYVYKYDKGTSSFGSASLLWEYSSIDDAIYENEIFVNQYCPNFGSGLYSNGTICTLQIDGHSVPTYDKYIAFFGLDINLFPPLPINYIELDDITDNIIKDYGVLIFPNEEHNIEINFNENVTYVFIELEDAENYIRFNYDVVSDKISTKIINKKDETVKKIAYITEHNITDNEDNLTLSFDFIFNDDVVDYYSQILDYGVLYDSEWYNFTSQIRYSIFNLGGIPTYSGYDTYTIYSDNDIFSIGAQGDGSWIRFDVLYNKLQHMHFNVEFDIDGDWDSVNGIWENCTGGFYEYGMDYFIKDELLEGWKVRIYPSSVVVGHQNLGVDYDYIQWTIEHYFYNRTLDDYQLIKTDFIYSNFNGYDNEDSTPDYHNRTSTTFWVDLWFSNDDSNRKVATRLNSEWYGMYEQGTSWWFGYGNFRPVIGDLTNSIFYDNVYDENMTITTIKGNVDLVRFWGKVEKVTGGGNKEYKMYNYLMKNKELALNEMIGIDTPALVETKVMDMPQTGFLTPLINALSGIKDYIINGIIYLLLMLATAFDSILISLGLPPLFSMIITIITSIKDIVLLMIGVIPQLASYSLTILNGIIDILFLVIGRWIYIIPMWFDSTKTWITFFIAFFTGGLFPMNIWTTFALGDFLFLGINVLFPIWWVDHVLTSDSPVKTFIEDIKSFYGFLTGILGIFLWFYEILGNIIGILLGMK